jgi:hypothetical protein
VTGPAGDWHRPPRRHLRLCREQEWGVCPPSPDWQAVPLVGDGFALRAANERFRPATLFGGWRRSVHLSHLIEVAGELVTLLWPQTAALLLGMALDREEGQPASYCADHYTPADPRRCLGVVAERLRLRAPAGRDDVELRLSLRARCEEANPALTEGGFDYSTLSPAPFAFGRAAVALDEAPVTDVEGFVIEARNQLTAGPNSGGSPAFLSAGQRAVSLELTALDDGDALSQAIREGGTLGFQADLTHPEGHTLTLALPVLHPETAETALRPGALVRSTVRMEAGTDEAGDDVTYAVNLSD